MTLPRIAGAIVGYAVPGPAQGPIQLEMAPRLHGETEIGERDRPAEGA